MDDYRAASLQGWSTVAPDWAQLVDRIDRQLGPAADWILNSLALSPGERVLELAGGPGTLSMLAAHAVGPSGRVTYSDFAEPMVEVARERLSAEDLSSVECRVIDAEAIDLADEAVDAVACRMGYMLMADPAAALRETARVLARGGRVALAVWAEAAANPWAALPMQAIASHLQAPPPPPDAPGLWSLAEETRLRGMLEAAGFESIRIEPRDASVEFDSAQEWIETTRRLAGPLRALFSSLDEDARATIERRMLDAAKPYEQPDGRVSMPERMLLAYARR
jgi:SAM-dependent methyltransferase